MSDDTSTTTMMTARATVEDWLEISCRRFLSLFLHPLSWVDSLFPDALREIASTRVIVAVCVVIDAVTALLFPDWHLF